MDNQVPADNEKSSSIQNDSTGKNHQSLAEIWENIITIGLGEQALRIGSILISLVLILMVVWVMGTFYLKGNLVHFAVHKTHLGFYPAPSGIEHFKDELSGYEYSKGAIRFPLDRPTPLDLVRRITAFRAKENLAQAAMKAKKG